MASRSFLKLISNPIRPFKKSGLNIATIVPGVPSGEPTPLQGGSHEFVSKLRPLAEQHAKVSGHKVRLVRFRRDQALEDISPQRYGLSP